MAERGLFERCGNCRCLVAAFDHGFWCFCVKSPHYDTMCHPLDWCDQFLANASAAHLLGALIGARAQRDAQVAYSKRLRDLAGWRLQALRLQAAVDGVTEREAGEIDMWQEALESAEADLEVK